MHYRCVFTLFNWLCSGRIGLGWAHDVFNIAHHMLMHFHAYIPYILYILIYWLCLVLFYMFLSPSLSLVYVSCIMAPKHKSTHPLLLILLPHMFDSMMRRPKWTSLRTFPDEAFILNTKSLCDFSDTNLPTVIHSKGWKSLCDILITCPSLLI